MSRRLVDMHRRIMVGVLGRYIGAENRCIRDLIGWLAAGSESTRTGLMRVHVGSLCDDLGWSKPQIRGALTRLHDDGLIIWCEEARTALCVYSLAAATISTENHRKSYLSHCETFPDCSAKSAAVKAIKAAIIIGGKGALHAPLNVVLDAALHGASDGARQGTGYRVQGTGISIPNGMPAAPSGLPDAGSLPHQQPSWQSEPAPTPKRNEPPLLIRNPHLRALKGLDPLPDEPQPQPIASQPEPEPADDEVPEWASLAASKAAAPEAVPPTVQMPLDLRPPKRKELTDKQLDAIFAKEQMAKWVAAWNEHMARVCVPAVAKDVMPAAKVLIGNLAVLNNPLNPLACPTELLRWAKEHSDYHNGKKGRKWTLKQWLSTDHVGQLFADYREYCAQAERHRSWRFLGDRTLTDWRIAVQEETERRALMAREAADA